MPLGTFAATDDDTGKVDQRPETSPPVPVGSALCNDKPTPPSGHEGKFCVIVENLPADMDAQELQAVASDFAKVGKLKSAKLLAGQVGELKYTTAEDMKVAIKKLERRRIEGSGDKRLHAYEKPP